MAKKSAKKDLTETAETPKPKARDKGLEKRIKGQKVLEGFVQSKTDIITTEYIEKRSNEMIDFRRNLKIQGRWKEADDEYIPHELDFGTTRKRFETDQDTGLRSRMVPVGDVTQQWRTAGSSPTLLAKIHTALSLIVGNMPEADLVALEKKYKDTTDLAYSLWKRNWQITDAKNKLVLFIFNLFKYGWAAQRTYPRLVKFPKQVLVAIDTENPENNKYEERENVWFNDIDREPLNVHRTWIDETAKPYDMYSMKESYFEIDYSHDAFLIEFGMYPNAAFVPKDSYMFREDQHAQTKLGGTVPDSTNVESKKRQDIVTVGFFESRTKDLFCIYIPKWKMPVFYSPLPNDDGYLSITHTMYLLRSDKHPYGVSLWETIRQNKSLYDKMKNMSMDQLILSIMKFGFFSGTNPTIGDGIMQIVPGEARQLNSSTGKPEVNWMEIPGPGQDAWTGLEKLSDMMDNDSGITPTLAGTDQPGDQTLGQIKLMQESALGRIKVPLDNVAWLIEQDAYLSLSWMSQVYSVPTIKEFTNSQEMVSYEAEEQVTHHEVFQDQDENGAALPGASLFATYLPQIALHLEDSEGKLIEGKDSKFFQLGDKEGQIKPKQLKWRGIFKVIPRSIIDSSQEVMKASKTELFNIIVPLLEQDPSIYGKAVNQLMTVNEEDPSDWLPDAWVQYIEDGTPPAPIKPSPPGTPTGASGLVGPGMPPQEPAQGAQPAPGGPQSPPGTTGIPQGPGGGAGGAPSLFMPKGGQGMPTMQNKAGMTPKQASTVVPRHQVSTPPKPVMAGKPHSSFNVKM